MIKEYSIIQVIDSEACDDYEFNRSSDLAFGIIKSMEDEYHFDEYDEDDEPIYEDAIMFRVSNSFNANYIRKEDKDSYVILKPKVEYYKNGNIKKCIIKGGRKVRLLSPSKTGKNVGKRTKRMVRG